MHLLLRAYRTLCKPSNAPNQRARGPYWNPYETGGRALRWIGWLDPLAARPSRGPALASPRCLRRPIFRLRWLVGHSAVGLRDLWLPACFVLRGSNAPVDRARHVGLKWTIRNSLAALRSNRLLDRLAARPDLGPALASRLCLRRSVSRWSWLVGLSDGRPW